MITVTLTQAELTQLIRAGNESVNLGISKLIQERNNNG